MTLPSDRLVRKEHPLARGLLDYFPDALAAVAHVSHVGNQQHNPGEPLHWDKTKSTDHADCIMRHLVDRGEVDTDGLAHSAKVAWRALALLQTEIESDDPGSSPSLIINSPSPSKKMPKQGVPGPDRPRLRPELLAEGCSPQEATWIMEGITLPPNARLSLTDKRYSCPMCYISGPMRGRPALNFPAFDRVRDALVRAGYGVISPADVDRASGFDGTMSERGEVHALARQYASRDFHALKWLRGERGEAIVMLPDWAQSVGASAEMALARWLGLKILNAAAFTA